MLCKEIIADYTRNRKKHIYLQNTELQIVNIAGT
jgi:hypothetical protein